MNGWVDRRCAVIGLLAAPVAVRAQERVYRVGYLSWQDEGTYYDVTLRGFLDGLRSEGFVEGKNLQLVRRSASNDADRFKPLANDLARIPVDLYFAPATPMATAAWYADKKTPIVIATIMDPVELKFVDSLARPGTRVTGVTTMNYELTFKRLQLLMEVVPGLKRVGVVIDEAMREACTQELDHAMKAAKQLGVTIVTVHIDRPELLDAGVQEAARRQGAGGDEHAAVHAQQPGARVRRGGAEVQAAVDVRAGYRRATWRPDELRPRLRRHLPPRRRLRRARAQGRQAGRDGDGGAARSSASCST